MSFLSYLKTVVDAYGSWFYWKPFCIVTLGVCLGTVLGALAGAHVRIDWFLLSLFGVWALLATTLLGVEYWWYRRKKLNMKEPLAPKKNAVDAAQVMMSEPPGCCERSSDE